MNYVIRASYEASVVTLLIKKFPVDVTRVFSIEFERPGLHRLSIFQVPSLMPISRDIPVKIHFFKKKIPV